MAWHSNPINILGLLVLSQTAAVTWLLVEEVRKPVPYRHVELASAVLVGQTLSIVAKYTKTNDDCDLVQLRAFGTNDEGRTSLEYAVIRQPGQTAARLAGPQTMRLDIDLAGGDFDTVSIMTRHDCDGTSIDKRMLGAPVPKGLP